MRAHHLIAAALIGVSIASAARAQNTGEKPAELDVLDRYVGDWTSDVTSNSAVWTPDEIRLVTSNHAEFVLDEDGDCVRFVLAVVVSVPGHQDKGSQSSDMPS